MSIAKPKYYFRATDPKTSSWIDVNREAGRRPGSFRSRNIGLDRFFDTQRRHERSAAREQWTQRNVLPNRFQNSEGKVYACNSFVCSLKFHFFWL